MNYLEKTRKLSAGCKAGKGFGGLVKIGRPVILREPFAF
jgi:hypothetical protein